MPSFFAPLIEAFPSLLAGAWITIYASVFGILLAMVFAIPAGLGRLSKNIIIRSVCSFYVETIRGTPLLLQLIVWYYGVRILLLTLFNLNVDVATYNLLTALNSNSLYPIGGISGIFFAIFGLAFNYGAYLAEVIRAGVQAVEPGQTEAAQSLGLSRFQTTRLIVLPQALRIMIPPLTNNHITLIQDTSFFQVLAVFELSLVTFGHVQEVSNAGIRWEFFGFELIVYFVICYSLALVAQRMERRNGAAPGPRGSFPYMFLPPALRPRRPPIIAGPV